MDEIKVPILTRIQNELKAPKNQWNAFGKYKYRNAEDIESALKPLLAKYGAQLTFDEDYREVGGRIYAVEIATYKDSQQEITVKGWARVPESKKGMDDSQISGSASSYATKYALGKLFLIDDTKDADSQKPQANQGQQPSNRTAEQSAQPKKQSTKELYAAMNVAKKFEVQYGGGKEKLVDICGWAKNGDEQAQLFLKGWTKKDVNNLARYNFIMENGLETK